MATIVEFEGKRPQIHEIGIRRVDGGPNRRCGFG